MVPAMPVAPLAAFLAMALAASPQPPPAAPRVAATLPDAASVVMTALPPPPSKVVRTTRTYGTITLDHAAHLERKISCKSCHGGGPVTKIAFTPRLAHDTCRGCHVQVAKGPTDCRGCHVVAPKEAPAVAEEGPKLPAGAVIRAGDARPAAGATPLAAVAPPGAPGSTPARPPAVAGDDPEGGMAPFLRTLEAGFSVLGASDRGGVAAGPAIRLTSRYQRAVLSHSLEWVGGRVDGRALFLVGGGAAFPLRDRLAMVLVASGGVDAAGHEVVLMPALGARVGLELQRATPWLDTLTLSVSGVSDLVRRRNAFDERVGGTMVSVSLMSGFRLNLAPR